MQDSQSDPSGELMLDGNAVAGTLREVFGVEMTANEAQCASCKTVSQIGSLLVFGGAMGNVMRCPHCQEMMMRIVSRQDDVWIEMRGVSYLKQAKAGR